MTDSQIYISQQIHKIAGASILNLAGSLRELNTTSEEKVKTKKNLTTLLESYFNSPKSVPSDDDCQTYSLRNHVTSLRFINDSEIIKEF